MIGSIRKHSVWLWWVIAALTIISFIWWGASPGSRYGSGRRGGLGTIYGKPVTQEAFAAAQREFLVYYWSQYHQFPDKNPNFTRAELDKETYVRLMLKSKAEALGIHVDDAAQVALANEFLTSLGQGKPVPMSVFVDKVLQPEGLTAADFQGFIVDDLAIQQLVQSLGLSGALMSPQEVGQIYDRLHQDYSAQAVFFSASNYISQVAVTPAAVSLFYSNNLAALYRLPNRLQVNYVAYELSNYTAAAEAKLGKTNIAAQVDAVYAEKGMEAVPDAKTPEEAKAKIRDAIVRQAAAKAALDDAMKLVNPLFAMDPPLPDNLVSLAKKDGLTVHATAPFSEADGPVEFPASADLVKAMFNLNADSPFIQKPIVESDAIYVIGLKQMLPSAIEPLSEIRDRVVEDYKNYEATLKARAAGTNFYYRTAVQMATGKTFAQVALADGQAPVALKPFSLSSREIPEADDHADVREIQNAAYTTQVGHISQFEPTADGGFVLFVQSLLPVDQAAKNADLPAFTAQLRRSRESEAFNLWVESEANRELANIPELVSARTSPRSQ